MVCSLEFEIARFCNKKTDTLLMYKPLTPADHALAESIEAPLGTPYLTEQMEWYRMDWGTGGNRFPPHLTPCEPGVPWTTSSRRAAERPSYEPPPDFFAGLGTQEELKHQQQIQHDTKCCKNTTGTHSMSPVWMLFQTS